MCKRMSCKHYLTGGDRTMNRKKKWYDYLWIASLTYLILGFFNILFAWLGLLCFFIPLFISILKGNKAYCNKYCGRGQLFSLIGGRFGLSRKKDIPKWMKSKYFHYGFLIFFFNNVLPYAVEYLASLHRSKKPWRRGNAAVDFPTAMALGISWNLVL